MTETQQKVWSLKVGRSIVDAPKLTTLPPTNEASGENVAQAHLQVAIWKQALESDPPSLQPNSYGWGQNSLNSVMPTRKTQRCGCGGSNMACTIFCSCEGSKECCDVHTKQTEMELDDE